MKRKTRSSTIQESVSKRMKVGEVLHELTATNTHDNIRENNRHDSQAVAKNGNTRLSPRKFYNFRNLKSKSAENERQRAADKKVMMRPSSIKSSARHKVKEKKQSVRGSPVKLDPLPELTEEKSPVKCSPVKSNDLGVHLTSDVKPSVQYTSDNESDAEDYERRRRKNLEDNANFLASLGVPQLVDFKIKPVRTTPGIITKKQRSPSERLPRRQSLRIRRMDPSGAALPEPPPVFEPVEEHPRKPSAPLKMSDVLHNKVDDDVQHKFIHSLKNLDSTPDKTSSKAMSSEVAALSALTLTQISKVVPQRIFSMAAHSAEDRLLVGAGGKWGQVGLWDVSGSSVCCFEPHSRPVSCLKFSSTQLYSSSYDGTLRRGDLHQAEFTQVYATPEDNDVRISSFDLLSPDSLIVGQSDGCVAVVDTRASVSAQNEYQLHSYTARCVHVHPVSPQYIVTASSDSTVCVWDMRKLSHKSSKPLSVLRHERMVDSAYFSPLTGQYILTTGMDDRLNVFDSSELSSISQSASVRYLTQYSAHWAEVNKHDNHTGRWLTKFRATWQPQREDVFVVGSMKRPRRIELFNTRCQSLCDLQSPELNSVCSLNVFHPTKNVLFCGNSSGRVHVFM